MVTKGADLLFQEIHKVAKQYVSHPKVKNLLQWADRVTEGSASAFKPSAKRAVAMLIASVSDINRVSDIDKLSDIARDIDSDIASASVRVRFSTFLSALVREGVSASISDVANAIAKAIDIASDSIRSRAFSSDDIRESFIGIASDSISVNIIIIARATARGIARAIDRDSDIVRAIDRDNDIDIAKESFRRNLASAVANGLEKSNIFTRVELSKLTNQLQNLQVVLNGSNIVKIKEVSEQAVSAYLEAFHLTQEMITFNDEESQALSKYLYSIDLLLKCKQEAARLSPATWDAIEAELLLPPDD
jgi:hypothetical protein